MSETKELVSLEQLQSSLAVVAEEESSSEHVANAKQLSVKGRRFSLGDERLGDELTVVVVATAYENAYYENAYNPDKVSSPGCFSVQETDEDMTPHETSPNPQSDSCASCPMNEWGSGNGKGKACKNGRRLIILPYGADGLGEQVVSLRLPPTSIKNWAAYSKAVTAREKLPTYALVTKLSFDPKSDWPVVMMDLDKRIDNAAELQAIIEKRDEYVEMATQPYDVSNYEKDEGISASKKSKMS